MGTLFCGPHDAGALGLLDQELTPALLTAIADKQVAGNFLRRRWHGSLPVPFVTVAMRAPSPRVRDDSPGLQVRSVSLFFHGQIIPGAMVLATSNVSPNPCSARDLRPHQFAQGCEVMEQYREGQVGRLRAAAERVVQGVEEQRLDVRDGESFGRLGELQDIEVLRRASDLGDLNAPDGFPLLLLGKIDKQRSAAKLPSRNRTAGKWVTSLAVAPTKCRRLQFVKPVEEPARHAAAGKYLGDGGRKHA